MMPDDLLKPLSDDEVRALVAYLRHPAQTPMLATPDNVKDFFNGKDLTGWDGDPKLWSGRERRDRRQEPRHQAERVPQKPHARRPISA